jgi:post-segregation antitoxin (ccd killing protein)
MPSSSFPCCCRPMPELPNEQERRWLQENQEATAQYNLRVAELGLLSDDAGLL